MKEKLDKVSEDANTKAAKLLKDVEEIDEDTLPEDIRKHVTEVVIPSNVKSIGYWAFWSCKFLKSIEIPESVKRIGV